MCNLFRPPASSAVGENGVPPPSRRPWALLLPVRLLLLLFEFEAPGCHKPELFELLPDPSENSPNCFISSSSSSTEVDTDNCRENCCGDLALVTPSTAAGGSVSGNAIGAGAGRR